MIPFDYVRAGSVKEAIRFGAEPRTRFIAGGTNLVDLMKETVERPTRLIDIGRLNLDGIEERPNGGVRLGALAPNADTAYNPIVQRDYLASVFGLSKDKLTVRNPYVGGAFGSGLRPQYQVYLATTPTPGDMRAPGAASGMNVFECAIDELAYEAKIDPLLFRRLNYTDIDPMSDKPFTSKALRQAYDSGAEAFGWKNRPIEPRSMHDGHELTGWGMATGMWDAMFVKTSARARLSANGNLEVATAASDIGTATYTILAQVASDTLGVTIDDISVKIGDSDLPTSPVEGGSWMAA
jgi:CO/xanthine dehydrogenase Mo-binding subunit